jgi:hypothetical protein
MNAGRTPGGRIGIATLLQALASAEIQEGRASAEDQAFSDELDKADEKRQGSSIICPRPTKLGSFNGQSCPIITPL